MKYRSFILSEAVAEHWQDVWSFLQAQVMSKLCISGLQIRVRIGKLFSLFLIQNICCGYSKEPSQ